MTDIAFRGYFALDGVEIANSSRVVAHLGRSTPTDDYSMFSSLGDLPAQPASFTENTVGSGLYNPGTLSADADHLFPMIGIYLQGISGLYPVVQPNLACGIYADDGFGAIPESSTEVSSGLYTPPNGARRYGPGLYEVGSCWGPAAVCSSCSTSVPFGDDWDGLAEFLNDGVYRPEVAPWYTLELPESGEFGGVWVMKVDGLDTTPIERPIVDTVGNGAVAGPPRDAPRHIMFEALLIGCSNAGVDYGLKWLTSILRVATAGTNSSLKYLSAHPGDSAVDPDSLVREVHNVVMTKAPEILETIVTGTTGHRQGNMYRISWEMTALVPYAYLPAVRIPVDWDKITRQPINWIHAADCHKPETCEDMPVMFSTNCVPEEIMTVVSPPPVCGGCMPVSEIAKYSFQVPTQEYAFRSRETSVTMVFTNTGDTDLTLQAFWRVCGTDYRCEDNQWPLRISGLPVGAELHLDAITGRYWAYYDERVRRPIGVVGTPNGAPWRPPLIDRKTCWEFVVQTAPTAGLTVDMILADREP